MSEQRTKQQAQESFANKKLTNLKYGLTIRLNTKDITLVKQPENNQQLDITETNCIIQPLFESTHHYIDTYLHSVKAAEYTIFEDYNHAHQQAGLLIIVEKNKQATLELKRVFESAYVEHLLVVVEENATLKLTDYQEGDTPIHSATVEVIAKENAQVQYATIANTNTPADLVSYRGYAEKNAQIDWFIANYSTGFSRATVDTTLAGKAATARSYGVFLGSNNEQFDLSATTFHIADKTSSDMHTKGVLAGSSKGVYRGTLDIASDAFGCDGYQKEHTLLLSEDAVADAIPNLEIRNNDVACSHGATIGRVDENQLLYLTSRGINKQEAIRMIATGFFESLSTAQNREELYEQMLAIIHKKLA